MISPRQEALAKQIVEDELNGTGRPLKELLIKAGYSKETAEATPGEVIQSKGVQQAIEKHRETMQEALEKTGVTPTKISKAIDELVDNKDHNAKSKGIDFALKLGIGGGYQPQKSIHITADLKDTQDYKKAKEIADKYEQELLNNL